MNLVINLDKPKGMTSQEAVTAIKKILHVKKAGHAGTLDPIATGVLLICLNEATKITRFLTDLDKEYIARIKLGEKTDTLDSEGKVIEKVEKFSVTEEEIIGILNRFQGEIEQTPPMYSAIKMNGKPLYKLARKGVTVEREKRLVRINRIDLLGLDAPFVDIRVSCSKGTYIRSLCSDIGDALGVGGHVTELRRISVGNFTEKLAITMDELRRSVMEKAPDSLLKGSPSVMTIDMALMGLDEILLSKGDAIKAGHGVSFRYYTNKIGSRYVRLKDADGHLFGIGRVEGGIVKIENITFMLSLSNHYI
ncbi:MAG: tRNA pseudouridine(55) synthase TruB [Thermodesulfovibrionales bacterium]